MPKFTRKGQIRIIERAKRDGYTSAQMAVLKRTDVSIRTLNNLYCIMKNIPDFPLEEAGKVKYCWDYYFHSNNNTLLYAQYKRLIKGGMDLDVIRSLGKIRTYIVDNEKEKDFFSFCKKNRYIIDGLPDRGYIHFIDDIGTGYFFNRKEIFTRRTIAPIEIKEFVYRLYLFVLCGQYFVENSSPEYVYKNIGTRHQRLKYLKKSTTEPELNSYQLGEYIRKRLKPDNDKIGAWYAEGLPVEEAAKEITSAYEHRQENAKENILLYDIIRNVCPDGKYTYFDFVEKSDKKAFDYMFKKTNMVTTMKPVKWGEVKIDFPRYEDAPENAEKPLFVTIGISDTIRIDVDNKGKRRYYGIHVTYHEFIFYGNGNIYIKRFGKYLPVMVRDFIEIIDESGSKIFLDALLSLPVSKKSMVLLDVIRDCRSAKENGLVFPAIYWNDCIGFMSRDHLMKTKYKNGQDINWNRLDINRGYAYMKTKEYVDEKSKNILYNAITNKIIRGNSCRSARRKNAVAEDVLSAYLEKKLLEGKELAAEDKRNIKADIKDYVHHSLNSKTPVSLKWKSFRKVQNANIDMALSQKNEDTPDIIVPKDSVFSPLDDVFKEGFEKITSRKRIIQEGSEMRHCVAMYAESVNADRCAIYHLEKDGRAYTVEIRIEDGKYIVNQIQAKCDRGAPAEVWDYVETLILDLQVPKKKNRKIS